MLPLTKLIRTAHVEYRTTQMKHKDFSWHIGTHHTQPPNFHLLTLFFNVKFVIRFPTSETKLKKNKSEIRSIQQTRKGKLVSDHSRTTCHLGLVKIKCPYRKKNCCTNELISNSAFYISRENGKLI